MSKINRFILPGHTCVKGTDRNYRVIVPYPVPFFFSFILYLLSFLFSITVFVLIEFLHSSNRLVKKNMFSLLIFLFDLSCVCISCNDFNWYKCREYQHKLIVENCRVLRFTAVNYCVWYYCISFFIIIIAI